VPKEPFNPHSEIISEVWGAGNRGLSCACDEHCDSTKLLTTSSPPNFILGGVSMRQRIMACLTAILVLASVCSGQHLSKRMTNDDVVQMVTLGLSEDVIVAKINATPETDFDTDVEHLRALKAAKVPDRVISAMITPHAIRMAVNNASPLGVPSDAAGFPQEIGVYAMLRDKTLEIEPEIVGWKTGGVLKTVATLGLDKGHVNGKIMRPHSPVQLQSPFEFVIKTPDGTSVTEYQLLRLYGKDNRREFRAITGGILHASGGAERNDLSFQSTKIGVRTWRVHIEALDRGEYGFLPPGVSSASIGSSGKMYTFGVAEGGATGFWNSSASKALPSSLVPPANLQTTSTGAMGSIGAWSDGNPVVQHDGVTLAQVVAGGPADQVGIKVGDVILAINNHFLFTGEQLATEIQQHQPGERIAVRYRRRSTIYDTLLVVGMVK
jgi:hypothetical protein